MVKCGIWQVSADFTASNEMSFESAHCYMPRYLQHCSTDFIFNEADQKDFSIRVGYPTCLRPAKFD
jgi:hypothetical protein